MATKIPLALGNEAWDMVATAQQIDQCCGLGRGINLLDNWYFLDPINQRGKTVYEYPGDGRTTIDRWKNDQFKCELTEEGIKLSKNVADWSSFIQEIEFPDRLLGLPVTLSFLCKAYSGNPHIYIYRTNADGTGNSVIATAFVGTDYQVYSATGLVSADTERLYVRITSAGTIPSILIAAAKLEIGSEQTLASQDASGNWVLNDPPPHKALELAKCQRYQIQFVNPVNNRGGMVGVGSARSSTQCTMMVPSPAPITRSGTLAWSGKWVLYSGENSSWASGIPVVSMKVDVCPSNAVCLHANVESGLTVGNTYYLAYVPTSDGTKNSLIYDMNL